MDERFAPPGKQRRPKTLGWKRQHRAAMRAEAAKERAILLKKDRALQGYLERTGGQVDAMLKGTRDGGQ